MKRTRTVLWVALAVAMAPGLWAQTPPNFSGRWKLAKVDPPAATQGGGADSYSTENTFSEAPTMLNIAQTATQVTVQVGSVMEVFTLDNKVTVVPPGELTALKTWAHWEGATLHLHRKQALNWGRDVLTLSGGTLVVLRDLETIGPSTVRTLTYTKTS